MKQFETYKTLKDALATAMKAVYSESANPELDQMLQAMKTEIQKEGDSAVIQYIKKWDDLQDPDTFELTVSDTEIDDAYDRVDSQYLNALKLAHDRIYDFHDKQCPQTIDYTQNGTRYGLRYTAIDTVGLYVPGGLASYPSSVLMNAIPAKLAGVQEIVMVSPPNKEGCIPDEVLAAAKVCGVSNIVKVGGAQAIFALAYGTKSIPVVDKIVGPGNLYVTKAKQLVYGTVDIDKPAGPSEVLVYCHDLKYADYAAAELLAQLEHDPMASAICFASSQEILAAISSAFDSQLPELKRQAILQKSKEHALGCVIEDSSELVSAINDVASEHLVLLMDDYDTLLNAVKHAGSIFCGPYTPVTLGDYFAGPNHVLPTHKAARFASPLGVMDFMKASSFLSYSKKQLAEDKEHLQRLTDKESLDGHMNAVNRRFL